MTITSLGRVGLIVTLLGVFGMSVSAQRGVQLVVGQDVVIAGAAVAVT